MDVDESRNTAANVERTKARNRNTELGDRACFCPACGWARRYYPGIVEPPRACPACEAAVVHECAACSADILSVMAVDCDMCGAALREPVVNGVSIRRPPRARRVRPLGSRPGTPPPEPAADA